MAALDDLRPEVLEAQINEEEKAVEHLLRSNRELEAFLKETSRAARRLISRPRLGARRGSIVA